MDDNYNINNKNDIHIKDKTINEIHWIESESLFTCDKSTVSNNNNNNNNNVEHDHDTTIANGNNITTTTTVTVEVKLDVLDNKNDNDDDNLHLDDLFIDPDPYETFTLQWEILYPNLNYNISDDRDHEEKQYSVKNIDDETTPPDTTNISSNNNQFDQVNAQITVIGNKAENGQILHSTGLTLWRASRLLADYLVHVHNHNIRSLLLSTSLHLPQQQPKSSPSSVSKLTVLELGCGLGIPSMLYHYYLGASITIATDADIITLQNLRHNLLSVQTEQTQINHDNHNQFYYKTNHELICQQLIWGNETHIQNVLQTLHQHQLKTNSTSSITTTSNSRFDIILGSDIIYVPHVVEPLFDTVKQLILYNDGRFLLAFARRNVSIDYVLQIAKDKGFIYTYTALNKMTQQYDNCQVDEQHNKMNVSNSNSMEGIYSFRILQ